MTNFFHSEAHAYLSILKKNFSLHGLILVCTFIDLKKIPTCMFIGISKLSQSLFAVRNCKKSQKPRNWFGPIEALNDTKLILNNLGPIWYHSEPPDVPYCPNQFLGWDFFYRFLQQTSSRHILFCMVLTFLLPKQSKKLQWLLIFMLQS